MVLRRCLGRMLTRAQQAEQEGRIGDALRFAEAILSDYPCQKEARLVRARIWARTGRIEEALYELDSLVTQDPDDVEPRLALTGVLLLFGRYSESLDHLQVIARCCATEADRAEPALPSSGLPHPSLRLPGISASHLAVARDPGRRLRRSPDVEA